MATCMRMYGSHGSDTAVTWDGVEVAFPRVRGVWENVRLFIRRRLCFLFLFFSFLLLLF